MHFNSFLNNNCHNFTGLLVETFLANLFFIYVICPHNIPLLGDISCDRKT